MECIRDSAGSCLYRADAEDNSQASFREQLQEQPSSREQLQVEQASLREQLQEQESSTEQLQEHPRPSQIPDSQPRKRRSNRSVEPSAKGPLKRAHLTTTTGQAAQSIQQPKPLYLKRTYASFLRESVDQRPSSPTLKRYCPEAVNNRVTQWVESISGSESYRNRHCRSDTLLGHLDGGDIIPRRLAISAPNMEHIRDANGFTLLSTPASAIQHDDSELSYYSPSVTPSGVSGASSASDQTKSLVEEPSYRVKNLPANNIYIRPFYEEFPEDIAELVHYIRMDRDSLGVSLDQVKQDIYLHDLEMGSAEADVEKYFNTNIFHEPQLSGILKRSDRFPLAKHVVPNTGSSLMVSNPVPDILYGYDLLGAFTDGQQAQFNSMGTEMLVNSQNLSYPFFAIEVKADGPGGTGSLWVATNQCVGASLSCVNTVEYLNCRLRGCMSDKMKLINSAAFSIAMSGTEARLYISWKHEYKYYMQKVDSFLLQEPEHYLKFCKYVWNIMDWGKGRRLKEIQDSLNSLQEESRKAASQLAKSRTPSSGDSASNLQL